METFYRRIIVASAILLGGLYAGSCSFVEFRIIYRKYVPALSATHPVLLFIMGATFGIALGCLFAPTSFLRSKTGHYYLDVIGVKNIPMFRLKCLVLCVLFGTVTWVICWLVLPDLLENHGLLFRGIRLTRSASTALAGLLSSTGLSASVSITR